jgi:hypothetical protein
MTFEPENKRATVFPGSGWNNFSLESIPAEFRQPYKHKTPSRRLPTRLQAYYGKEPIPVIEASPLKHYKMHHSFDIGGFITIVNKVPVTEELFALRRFPDDDTGKLLLLRRLTHENLRCALEIYSFQNEFHVISEHTETSLAQIIVRRPTEEELASILYQVSLPRHV